MGFRLVEAFGLVEAYTNAKHELYVEEAPCAPKFLTLYFWGYM